MLVDFRSFSLSSSCSQPPGCFPLPSLCPASEELDCHRAGVSTLQMGEPWGAAAQVGRAKGEGTFHVLSMNEMPRADRKDLRPPVEAAIDMLCDPGQVTSTSGL